MFLSTLEDMIMKARNFVVKNMIGLNLGKTFVHKDKKKSEQQCRGQKHKKQLKNCF